MNGIPNNDAAPKTAPEAPSATATAEGLSSVFCSDSSVVESDPYQSEEYQRFIDEVAKTCDAYDPPCDSCLAGAQCDGPSDHEDFDEDAWCDNCGNLGFIDCRCGGDFCVCGNQGEIDCPDCSP